MTAPAGWVLLAYRVPREPSTPRIAIWRRLRALGAAQIGDGLVVLPADARSREQLGWVAQDVTAAGGEATIWMAQLENRAQERRLIAQMTEGTAAEYRALIEQISAAGAHADPVTRQRRLGSLRREFRRIGHRDYFPPEEREEARRALDDLARVVDGARA